MGLLTRGARVLVLVAAQGCYSPEVRDCTLACASESDCAAGQVCGSDRLCAAPERAGSCGTAAMPDGGVTSGVDARTEPRPLDAAVDAPVLPDAPTHGAISVRIEGKGHVRIDGHGTCDSDSPQNGMCVFVVPLATPVTVTAIADEDWRFDAWTTSTCPDESNDTCTFLPALTTPVGAKFRRGDD